MRVVASGVGFSYRRSPVALFRGIAGEWAEGTVGALRGPSGSGKSTFLDIIGGLRLPTEGAVVMDAGGDAPLPREQQKTACAWVLQTNTLLSRRSVIHNVRISSLIAGVAPAAAEAKSLETLDRLGLQNLRDRTVESLSGGEQQRVTIARCLLSSADVILADEPTGNLDARNTELVVRCLRLAAEEGKTVIVATHDPAVVDACDSALDLGVL